MKTTYTTVFCFLAFVAHSQQPKEKELRTEIKAVTVFIKGAQIFESGNITIPAGGTLLRIKNLSPYIEEKSIQVKAEGNFTILSVNHRYNYVNTLKKDVQVDSLRRILNSIDAGMARENARLQVLTEKHSLLNANKTLASTTGVTMVQLKQAMSFYEEEISGIKNEELKINDELESMRTKKTGLELQLKNLNEKVISPSGEIEVRVSSDQPVSTKFDISYMVANAGWFPKYDIRVQKINSPLELTYKAEVFQSTGIDWKNVRLRFSNGNPNQSGLAPELETWNLSYARYSIIGKPTYGPGGSIRDVRGKVLDDEGTPLPGVNVLFKGTSVGTVTDAEGNYTLTMPNGASTLVFSFVGYSSQELPVRPELNVQLNSDVKQLSEVTTTAYGVDNSVRIRGMVSGTQVTRARRPLVTAIIENQTTVEIEVETPYSIKSNGEKLQVDLKRYEVDALYQYYSIPKLDKDAFLVARIVNWDQYSLLEGEANLYFEDAFVGRSILDARALKDTLDISLGRDRSIVVGREKSVQYSRRRTIGSNVLETQGFRIVVRNKKSQTIKLTLFDQIPVAVINDISVNPVNFSNGLYDEKTGKVTWDLTINPQEQKELTLQYEVKYPKRERVVLE